MGTYTKSLSIDFSGNLESATLLDAISANGGIAPNILRIDTVGDLVKIVFDGTLSGSEQSTLDSIISSHVPPRERGAKVMNISARKEEVKSSTYQVIGKFVCSYIDITHASVISSMDRGIDSYSVRLYDATHNAVICEKTFTNTEEELNDMGELSDIAPGEAKLELQAKKNKGKGNLSVYIDGLTLWYR